MVARGNRGTMGTHMSSSCSTPVTHAVTVVKAEQRSNSRRVGPSVVAFASRWDDIMLDRLAFLRAGAMTPPPSSTSYARVTTACKGPLAPI